MPGPSRSIIANVLLIVVTTSLFLGPRSEASAGQPQESKGTKRYDISGGPLGAVLSKFAGVAGVVLSFDATQTKGMNSTGLQGEYSVDSGFAQLLAGRGLEAVMESNGTYTLRKTAATPQGIKQSSTQLPKPEPQEPEITLPQVTVQDSREQGYVATQSSVGTKTDTPLIEIPRSISVVTSAEMDERKVDEIGAALRYTPGVFAEHRGADTSRPHLVLRGFRDFNPVYIDGMRGHTTNFNSSNPDTYGLERLEVLRGPASILYGQNRPGGLVNAVTKQPTSEFFAEVEGHGGSFDQFGGKFDFGGPLDKDKTFLYRLTGLGHDGDTQVNFLKDERLFVAPAFTWRPNANMTLTLLSQYQKDDTFEALFVPAAGTVLPNPNGKIPSRFFVGEPGFGGYNKNALSLGYLSDYQWSESFKLSHNLRYERRHLDFKTVGGLGLQADNRTLDRSVFTAIDTVHAVTTDTNGRLKFNLGPTAHTALLGVDYKHGKATEAMGFTPGPAIDVFNPVYGQTVPYAPLFQDQNQKSYQVGIYFQNQAKLYDKLVLTLGGRHDWAATRTYEKLSAVTTKQHDSAFSGQAGVTYLFDNGLAPYFSYAESFEPVAGTDTNGSPFVPMTGTQYEVGVKYQPPGTNSFITLSVFELTQQNVVTTDPLNPCCGAIQKGEVKSKGVEVEARTHLFRDLNLIASYSFTDAKITKSNDGDQGKRPTRVPQHLTSLWADYTLRDGLLGGLGFGGGVRYVGSSYGNWENTFKVPEFTLVDTALHYDFKGLLKGMRLAVNASNIFDKSYVASCEAEGFCLFGARRVITGSIKFRW